MQIETFDISGPVLITPKLFADDRGYFFESYNAQAFRDAGLPDNFTQDNQSYSHKNVLRGLHFQHPPYDQGKLVRVVRGSVLDVAVDIRKNSPTYGRHIKILLNAANQQMFWIPPGFAHGFLSLEDNTVFLYKCTNVYHKNAEDGIHWRDPQLNIDWGIQGDPIVSAKDDILPSFSSLQSRFEIA